VRNPPKNRASESTNSRIFHDFPAVEIFKVDLSFARPDGNTRSSEVKYSVNLAHAKSVFQFDCLTMNVCVRFRLSDVLAKAVAAKKATSSGKCAVTAGVIRIPSRKSSAPRLALRTHLGF